MREERARKLAGKNLPLMTLNQNGIFTDQKLMIA
jgi:hypothetical protein